jgi:hypothetical protein
MLANWENILHLAMSVQSAPPTAEAVTLQPVYHAMLATTSTAPIAASSA